MSVVNAPFLASIGVDAAEKLAERERYPSSRSSEKRPENRQAAIVDFGKRGAVALTHMVLRDPDDHARAAAAEALQAHPDRDSCVEHCVYSNSKVERIFFLTSNFLRKLDRTTDLPERNDLRIAAFISFVTRKPVLSNLQKN